MATTKQDKPQDSAARLIDTIEHTELSALESVRKFVDTVDGVFPNAGEDGPRRKIIDSAFKMTEQLVAASNKLAQNIVDVTKDALDELDARATAAKQ
jgi:hypothetical protein